jgi:hypothetical protein
MKRRFENNKQTQIVQRLKGRVVQAPSALNINDAVLDLVMKCLYEDPDKDVVNLDEDIYKRFNIVLPRKVSERVWDHMKSSGLVNPLIGFGNAGKLELSNAGTRLMDQYGSYADYLHAQRAATAQQMPFYVQIAGNEPKEGDNNSPDNGGSDNNAGFPVTF